jgi:AcrR family transcriptional regulator
MSKRPGPNKDNLEATRKIFMDIAKIEFCNHGYPDASTTRIVNESGMARGSLYYHFGDKNGLFKAVYEELLKEALVIISRDMDAQKNPLDSLLQGAEAFLKLCLQEEFRKIVLIQSQSAMSYGERLQVMQGTLLGKLRAVMPLLIEDGYFPAHTPDSATTFVLGILGETGRTLDFSQNPEQDMREYNTAFATTIKMLHTKAA